MKKLFVAVCFCFCAFTLYGNAGIFKGSGQTPVLTSTAKIQMVEEEVTMVPMRGDYPQDSSLRKLDPMLFHCKFKLRNLTAGSVTIQVGFPLSSGVFLFSDPAKLLHQAETAGLFGFTAGTKDKLYPVRFALSDKEKKFSNLFLWDMTFQPKEEITLHVIYRMEGGRGLMSTQSVQSIRENAGKVADIGHQYLEILQGATGQWHQYITETGGSWAGKIEKAVFRIYPFDFEEYLLKRGSLENWREEREKYIRKKQGRRKISPEAVWLFEQPFVRNWNPPSGEWEEIKDKRGKVIGLELVRAPFQPEGEKDNIFLNYVFPKFPATVQDFHLLLGVVKDTMDRSYARRGKRRKSFEKNKKDNPEVSKNSKWVDPEPFNDNAAKNLADAVLEFYGITTHNPELEKFLNAQCWYPVKTPKKIDPALKAELEKFSKKQGKLPAETNHF